MVECIWSILVCISKWQGRTGKEYEARAISGACTDHHHLSRQVKMVHDPWVLFIR